MENLPMWLVRNITVGVRDNTNTPRLLGVLDYHGRRDMEKKGSKGFRTL